MAQRVAERIPADRMPADGLEGQAIKNGPAAAAILASGIGCLMLGIATTLAESNAAIGSALNLYPPVGNLSGKTAVAIAVWLVSWAVLHLAWKDKQVDFAKVFPATLILIALGFLGTFPIFFDLFS